MIELGKYNTLRIDHSAEQGLYLQGDELTGDVLLPRRYVTPSMHIGDDVRVFIYLDQDERLIATTETPLATVGEFAFLRVAWTNKYGAFLSWGLLKDLFCPFREQKQPMQRGKGYIVYVKEDEESHRLMATAKVERYISPCQVGGRGADAITHGTAVDCLIWQKTDLGFKVIVKAIEAIDTIDAIETIETIAKPRYYQGQLYDNQVFQPLRTGDRVTAYVDHVRQDGKIDLTLQPTGHRHTLDLAETLLRYLHENGGHCDLGDDSAPELIYDRFKVSKKAYKRAIGDLYRRHLIVIGDDGIALA
ncbi:MAG: GntR family transcriptional regulator [Prevotella sp.]|nr:GntR family transcriptional regulator [Prevotella sp.]